MHSLWKESFDDSVEELFLNLPFVFLGWLLLTALAVQLKAGEGGQVTVALSFLVGMAVFLVIFGIIFCTKTYVNLHYMVLKENQEYAKKRITFKEVFGKKLVFEEEGKDC